MTTQRFGKNDLHIILDMDPGTDDALALAVASVFFGHNIRAIVSTYGNVDGEQTFSNLVNLGGLLNLQCPLLQGSLHPLGRTFSSQTDFHGENGLCGMVLPPAEKPDCTKDFLEELYSILKSYGKVTYVAVGPLTNVSRLIERYPDAVNFIEELVIMGGGFDISNMEHRTEFNFCLDPVAVKNVFALPIKRVLAPLDMTHKLALSLRDIEDIAGICRERLPAVIDNAYHAMTGVLYANYETAVGHHEPGAIMHDATTLVYLLDRSKCEMSPCSVAVDDFGALSKQPDGYDTFVIGAMDRDFLIHVMTETFQTLRENATE